MNKTYVLAEYAAMAILAAGLPLFAYAVGRRLLGISRFLTVIIMIPCAIVFQVLLSCVVLVFRQYAYIPGIVVACLPAVAGTLIILMRKLPPPVIRDTPLPLPSALLNIHMVWGFGLVYWPVAAFMSIFIFDAPTHSSRDELCRHVMAASIWVFPLVYALTLFLSRLCYRAGLHVTAYALSCAPILCLITPAVAFSLQ